MFKVGDRVNVKKVGGDAGPAIPSEEFHGRGTVVEVDETGSEGCTYKVAIGDDSNWLYDDVIDEVANTHASLERVFALAVEQSQSGKGADRHGNGQSFDDQPIFTLNRPLGTNHGALFQVLKKTTESAKLASTGRVDMAKNELLGAMVYAAAAYLMLEETEGKNA